MEEDRIEAPQPQVPLRNPAHKVIAISAGEAHTLALSEDGKVYSWGRGAFGRLGNGSESDENLPVSIKLENGDSQNEKPLNFVGVAAGAYHSLALADDGSVWCWGYNTYSQLGFDGENVSVPHQLQKLVQLDSPQSHGDDSEENSETQLKCSAIEAGGMMSVAIDNLGVLWMWGNIPQPSSSDDDTFTLKCFSAPIPMWDFYGHTVVKVACGNEHVVALVSAGEKHTNDDDLVCYAWGNNKHGQLGLGDTESRSRPQVVTQFSEVSVWKAYEVACGAFHTVVLTLKKRPSDALESVCWTFGLGENGQLGHGTTQNSSLPESVSGLPEHAYFVAVDCGLFHTSVVSTAGEVWSWGMEKGLGLCPDVSFSGIDHGDAILPLQISCNGPHGPNFPNPKVIACGAAHTVLAADDGYKLWSWGRGRSGVLGNGKARDSYTPTMVLWPPLSEDFSDGLNSTDTDSKKPEKVNTAEAEKELSSEMEEMKLLKSKFSLMERYASILHGSLFGRPFEESDIPASLLESDSFDVAKAWQSMLEAADGKELRRLEMFYGNMVDGVKDKIMKRKIQEIVRECMQSSSTAQH
ncbi:Ultraviolet-B receptor UVR8 [Bienertia sinuspersici]